MARRGKAETAARYTTPALEKGLDILELFASTSDELTKREVARRLGRTVSEIFRMLVCLEQRGYIAQSPEEDRLRLTLKLFKLAQEHPPVKRLTAKALPVMHDVTHKINQSCHLGVLDGGQVIILAQVDAPTSTGFYVKAGSSVDLMEAATGHVILAHQRPEICNRAILEWQRDTNEEVPPDLHKHLIRIRQRGFEERASYQVNGVINISYPIFDDQGFAIAALSVPFLKRIKDPTTAKDVRFHLQRACLEISKEIGGE
ncbi:IclR family transcriptional regulator [Paracidobacterium acidisoli]|uniref:IclR family transcriptional regulator n=1 Tax=Paracidobacterium acidisoli TaxID=2303751 RepID=UPI0026C9CD64